MQNDFKIDYNIRYNGKDTTEKLDKRVARVVELLTSNSKTIAAAESCTGGMISQLITSVPGASAVFELGVCSYSNRIKHEILKVEDSTLSNFTEVSAETAKEMARGVRKLSGSDIAVSVTGIAGPGGGTAEKPVGTVYAGFDYEGGCFSVLMDMSGMDLDRETIRKLAVLSIFEIVEQLLTGEICNE